MKNYLLFLSLLILSLGCASDDNLLSEEEFTKLYLVKIKRATPSKTYRHTKELEVRTTGKEGGNIFYLGNAYLDYKKNPNALDAILNNQVAIASKSLNKHLESVKLEKIIPIIKHRSYLENVSDQFGDGQHMQVYDDYNSELIIVYAVDNPKTIFYLDKTKFAEFKMDRRELFKIAKENLFNMVSEKLGFLSHEGYSSLSAGGNFESSLILFPSLWKPENFDIKGDIIIGIPSRNKVLIVDSKNRVQVEEVKLLTRAAHKHSRNSTSRKLFKWNVEEEVFDVYD